MAPVHSLFHDIADGHVAGLEIDYRTGKHGGIVIMPQSHHRMSGKMSVQVGVGMRKDRYASARPAAGLRMIREFRRPIRPDAPPEDRRIPSVGGAR